jgi:hypothetical protein
MPVKKKAIKTEEIATETETVTEKTENIDILMRKTLIFKNQKNQNEKPAPKQ